MSRYLVMGACSRVTDKVVPAAQPCCARALQVSDETLLAQKPNVSVITGLNRSRQLPEAVFRPCDIAARRIHVNRSENRKILSAYIV